MTSIDSYWRWLIAGLAENCNPLCFLSRTLPTKIVKFVEYYIIYVFQLRCLIASLAENFNQLHFLSPTLSIQKLNLY